jgi:DNA polymerase III delta prime subunit
MNGLTPNCIDDFLFSNTDDRLTLDLILSRKLPFPFNGKSGILLHGTWGTGKSTLASLLPELLETANSGTWNFTNGVGQMHAQVPSHTQTTLFRCGTGGLTSTVITQTVEKLSDRMPLWHNSQHNYFVFDELDRLTINAQQSLRSTMDLKRCMFFFTTNYVSKVDPAIINRCHLVEMNQITTPSAYVPLGNAILQNMGLVNGVISDETLQTFGAKARGSLRNFSNDVVHAGLKHGGTFASTKTVE